FLKGGIMEQIDIDLLHTVQPYHHQSLVKLRRTKGQTANTPTLSSSASIPEIAEYLFNPTSIHEAIRSLNGTEALILRELVACGGRANSRDLALYLTSSGLLDASKVLEPPPFTEQGGGLYPTPHPH